MRGSLEVKVRGELMCIRSEFSSLFFNRSFQFLLVELCELEKEKEKKGKEGKS